MLAIFEEYKCSLSEALVVLVVCVLVYGSRTDGSDLGCCITYIAVQVAQTFVAEPTCHLQMQALFSLHMY